MWLGWAMGSCYCGCIQPSFKLVQQWWNLISLQTASALLCLAGMSQPLIFVIHILLSNFSQKHILIQHFFCDVDDPD
jgi:hypothetical protein